MTKTIVKEKQITSLEDMTLKQRKWLKIYLECGNATEAARQVYDVKNDNSASQIGWENLIKLDFAQLLEEAGVTDAKLINVQKEGLEATRASNAAILLQQNGKVVKAEEQGLIEVPDYLTRHKYLETALRLKKRAMPDQNIMAIQQNNLNITEDQIKRLLED